MMNLMRTRKICTIERLFCPFIEHKYLIIWMDFGGLMTSLSIQSISAGHLRKRVAFLIGRE